MTLHWKAIPLQCGNTDVSLATRTSHAMRFHNVFSTFPDALNIKGFDVLQFKKKHPYIFISWYNIMKYIYIQQRFQIFE